MRTLFRLIALALALSVSAPVFADFQRGVRNYQEIMAGRKKIEQLNQVELQEVLAVHKALERQRGSSSEGGHQDRLMKSRSRTTMNSSLSTAKSLRPRPTASIWRKATG